MEYIVIMIAMIIYWIIYIYTYKYIIENQFMMSLTKALSMIVLIPGIYAILVFIGILVFLE